MANNIIYVDFKAKKKIQRRSKLIKFFNIKKVFNFFIKIKKQNKKNPLPSSHANTRLKVYNYRNPL